MYAVIGARIPSDGVLSPVISLREAWASRACGDRCITARFWDDEAAEKLLVAITPTLAMSLIGYLSLKMILG